MEKDLGYRKVQCTARGSYITSLPKEWVQEVGLKKGNEVACLVGEDSSLILIPRPIMEGRINLQKAKQKEHWIYANRKTASQSLIRRITSLYIISTDFIHIYFQEPEIALQMKKVINQLVRSSLLGSEIIEETEKRTTIQVLIDHLDFPIEKAIRRMALLALSANNDAISALQTLNQNLIQRVIDTYSNVNRLNLYVVRQLKFALDQNLFKELGFKTPKEFLGYRIVANDIKTISDNALHIIDKIKTLLKMIEEKTLFLKDLVDEEVFSQIIPFNTTAQHLFEESLRTLFKRDYQYADQLITKLDSLYPLENNLIILMASKKLDPNVSSILSLMLRNSRQILDYSRNIAEVTLHRTIEETSSRK